MKNFCLTILFVIFLSFSVYSQTETLTNNEIILMTRAGLSKELIIRKVTESSGKYETLAQDLIDLKKAGVADEVIALMLEKQSSVIETQKNSSVLSENVPTSVSHIVLDPKEALRNAKTIAIEKSSIHPARQALEKELLKNKEWKDLDLNIVRHKEGADLFIEIGYVSLSWITRRYVWRVYDNKSGTVIAAGETTSWGNLSKNLASQITKKLNAVNN